MKPLDKKTLFNKNHITLELFNYSSYSDKFIYYSESEAGSSKNKGYSYWKDYKKKPKFETVRLKSPLGFYYSKEVPVDEVQNIKQNDDSSVKVIWEFIFPDKTYKLTYFRVFNGNSINIETTAFYIADNKSVADHFIDDLYKHLMDIFNEMKERPNHTDVNSSYFKEKHHINYHSYTNQYYNSTDIKPKNIIFRNLFGNESGYKQQTNDEKILSHGFDLKSSFRNIK